MRNTFAHAFVREHIKVLVKRFADRAKSIAVEQDETASVWVVRLGDEFVTVDQANGDPIESLKLLQEAVDKLLGVAP